MLNGYEIAKWKDDIMKDEKVILRSMTNYNFKHKMIITKEGPSDKMKRSKFMPKARPRSEGKHRPMVTNITDSVISSETCTNMWMDDGGPESRDPNPRQSAEVKQLLHRLKRGLYRALRIERKDMNEVIYVFKETININI